MLYFTGANKVEINSKILSLDDGSYKCTDCDYVSKFRHNLPKHIEAKHIVHSGYSCPVCLNVYATPGVECDLCHKNLKTRQAYRMHYHRAHGIDKQQN